MNPRLTLVAAAALPLFLCLEARSAERPRVYFTEADKPALRTKLQSVPWARDAYAAMKSRVDGYLKKCEQDPAYLTSRLAMNWHTRYTTPVCVKEKYVGGEGKAPVPTPRFAGARDWASPFAAPPSLDDLKPYADNDKGEVYMYHRESGKMAWTSPDTTGRGLEAVNDRIMQLAADAAFIYQMTGDERYARFAADILWTYMEGFSHVQPPKFPESEENTKRIIGMTSFEVIHEDIVTTLSLAFDGVGPYLAASGRDPRVIEEGLRRMIQRVVDGGGADGNWNLNQARIIAYGALSLDDDAAYPDGRGRQHFIDLVLNADLPRQRGITRVIHSVLDPHNGLWPEAPGYGFGAIKDLIGIASLAGSEPAARELLKDDLLVTAALSSRGLLHPNGLSIGLGDTVNTKVNCTALELLIADARRRGDAPRERTLTASLRTEIDAGRYKREAADLYALTHYVDELLPTPTLPPAPATFFAPNLNVFTLRIGTDNPDTALSAALFGSEGGHVHANGLAIELYGAGLIMGADPGRGSSYWQKDHGEYYLRPPAHNTVIVSGRSDYPPQGEGHLSMTLDAVEPAPGATPANAPSELNVVRATASFNYAKPAASQQRTLALIRTGPGKGFYVDIFRSRQSVPADAEFHDYLYHNMGTLELDRPLQDTKLLADPKLLKGYSYFQNERSAELSNPLHAVFTVTLPTGPARRMGFWTPAGPSRRLFAVDAPQNRAIRDGLPPHLGTAPMPTLVLRQPGPAWDRPFVAVFEPYLGDAATVRSVRPATLEGDDPSAVALAIEGDGYTALVLQTEHPDRTYKLEGREVRGGFTVIIARPGQPDEFHPPKP